MDISISMVSSTVGSRTYGNVRRICRGETILLVVKLGLWLLILGVALTLWRNWEGFSNWVTIVQNEYLESVASLSWAAPIVWGVTAVVLVTIGFPAESIHVVTGYLLGNLMRSVYGNYWLALGLPVSAFYMMAAGSFNYIMGRRLGDMIQDKPVGRMASLIGEAASGPDAVSIVALSRICPFIPYTLVNVVYGAVGINPTLFLITLPLSWPISFIFVWVGAEGLDGIKFFWSSITGRVLSGFGVLVLLIVTVMVYRKVRAFQFLSESRPDIVEVEATISTNSATATGQSSDPYTTTRLEAVRINSHGFFDNPQFTNSLHPTSNA